MRLQRAINIGLLLVLFTISGSPENRTQRSLVISRGWAASPRLPFVPSSSYGNRTHLSALKERNPEPIDERAVLFVSARTVGREALESSSAAFQTAARPSQL